MTIISKFISVDPNNLPDEEVLAIGYDDEMLVGSLYYVTNMDYVDCHSDNEYLSKVTAYIPVSQLVELYKDNNE